MWKKENEEKYMVEIKSKINILDLKKCSENTSFPINNLFAEEKIEVYEKSSDLLHALNEPADKNLIKKLNSFYGF